MSLFAQFATDKNKETEGVNVEYGPNEDGTIPTFTIARAGKSNSKYSKALEAATRPVRRQIEMQTLANETAEKLFTGVFVEAILKGWKNVRDESGKDIPFTKENALALFAKLPELLEDLQKQSNTVSLFRAEAMEDEAKN